jgi:hypothetical protein
MNPTENDFSATQRFLYGAVVGAILGTIVGTMPGSHAALGIVALVAGAVAIGGLAAASKGFWESLVAAWELVRVAFWRW